MERLQNQKEGWPNHIATPIQQGKQFCSGMNITYFFMRKWHKYWTNHTSAHQLKVIINSKKYLAKSH